MAPKRSAQYGEEALDALPLIRRAKYLERKLTQGRVPGRQFDVAEYLAFIRIFKKAGVSFEPAVTLESLQADPGEGSAPSRMEEPPVRSDVPDTFVPGEPKGRRFFPGGRV